MSYHCERGTRRLRREAFINLIDRLKKAFPNVKNVITDEAALREYLQNKGIDPQKFGQAMARGAIEIEEKIQFMRTANGTIYGAKFPDGTIYLNPERMDANVPIHEFSHVWEVLAPNRFAKGVELLKQTKIGKELFEQINSNPFYNNLTKEQKWGEALNTLIGNEGERLYHSKTTLGDWFREMLQFIGAKLGIKNLKHDVALSAFTKGALKDIMGGREVVGETGSNSQSGTQFMSFADRRKNIREAGTRFIQELKDYVAGKLGNSHVFQLGVPSEKLLAAGFEDKPIELSSEVLSAKENKHGVNPLEITDLVDALANPIAVFQSLRRSDSKVVLTEMKKGGVNMVVAVQIGKDGIVNDVRSIYPKDNTNDILKWIAEDNLMEWADKEKALDWITTDAPGAESLIPRPTAGGNNTSKSNTFNVKDAKRKATKIIQEFENPTIDEDGSRTYTRFMADGTKQQVKTLPTVTNGFYSPIEKKLLDEKAENLSANKWLERLGKGDEMVWTGLKDFLESKKPNEQVKKSELQAFMKDNRIVVAEVVKGGDEIINEESKYAKDAVLRKAINEAGNRRAFEILLDNTETLYNHVQKKYPDTSMEEIADDVFGRETEPTKFSQHQLNGDKSNYKEVLVTMPKKDPVIEPRKASDYSIKVDNESSFTGQRDVIILKNGVESGRRYGTRLTDKEIIDEHISKRDAEDIKVKKKEGSFKSTHFDEPNILVHLRMNTRTDAEGNKVLFLEEVQSDHNQEARKKGVRNEKEMKRISELADLFLKDRTKNQEGTPERIEYEKLTARNNTQGVPDAPFIKDTNATTKLGLKVALKEAVAQGADKIAWTTGEQQNERYDLSKQVDEIRAKKNDDGTYKINAAKDGNNVFTQQNVATNNLPDYVGKELAQKIIDDNSNHGRFTSYTGVDLQVGGKGMKGFYGSPSENNLGIVGKVAKSMWGDVKTVEIKATKRTIRDYELDGVGDGFRMYEKGEHGTLKEVGVFRTREDAQKWIDQNNTHTQHSITITPEMREQAQEGQPLFMAQMQPYLDDSELIKDKDGNVTGIKPEVAEAIRKERNRIEAEAKANGTWMKAPNGKPSKLTESQWVTVRTERFKAWFGDWENDSKNASKVVDENGEPQVMYHVRKDGNRFYTFRPRMKLIYFNKSEKGAKLASLETNHGSETVEVFIKSGTPLNTEDNPVHWTEAEGLPKEFEKANPKEYAKGTITYIEDEGGISIGVTSPNQIKSATGNVGTFSNETGDIRLSGKEKENSLSSQNEKGVPEQVRKGTGTENQRNNIESAAYITRAAIPAGVDVKGEYIGEKADGKALEDWAKDNGIWHDDFATENGIHKEENLAGVESQVYTKDGDDTHLYKVNNGIHHGTWNDFMNRLAAHNKYFPETAYELYGFTNRDGQLAPILRQARIPIARQAAIEEIKADLEKSGLDFKGINNVEDRKNGVIIRDLHKENAVITTDGQVAYIDPLIQFTEDSQFVKDLDNEAPETAQLSASDNTGMNEDVLRQKVAEIRRVGKGELI